MRTSQRGFTLIELLVVIAIIGLLASIISTALSNSRQRARDTRRITDIKQVKTGMDLFFADAQGYPDTSVWDAALGGTLQCNGKNLLGIPHDPLNLTQGIDYDYTASGTATTGCGVSVRPAYELEFYIESTGLYYIMNDDGNVRERDSGDPVSLDSLI